MEGQTMSRRVGIVCAVLLLSAAGCTLDSFFVSITGPGRSEKTVAGSMTDTEQKLTVALNQLHIHATRKVNGEEVRLLARTPQSGKAFALVLSKQKGENGSERTLVGVEWDKEADPQFWALIADAVLAPPARVQPGAEGLTPAPATPVTYDRIHGGVQ
jgi:hypothetical protein